MGKKKSGRAQGGGESSVRFRCSPAYKAWLERFARGQRTQAVSDVIDRALVELAGRLGWPELAPPRLEDDEAPPPGG